MKQVDKYPVNLTMLRIDQIYKLSKIFKDIGTEGRYRLDQEGEDAFRLKCREVADEIAKRVINQERNRFGLDQIWRIY